MVWELTNSKFDVERLGKEAYMSEKLTRISEDALFVKLADMLYNINDRPQDKAYVRMLKNTSDLVMARDLSEQTKKLAYQVFAS